MVLAYRSRSDLLETLPALRATTGGAPDLLVVENGCPEQSAESVSRLYPGAEVIRLPKNLGFAGGANVALEKLRARGVEDVLFLNADARPEPGWLDALRDAADARLDAGILGSLLLDVGGEALDVHQKALLEGEGKYPPADEPIEVKTAIGAALWLRGPALGEVGGFDPLYFAYGEETDLCRRVRARGFKVLLVPRSRVRHVGEGSSRSALLRLRVRWLRVRNDGLLLLKRPRHTLRTGIIDLPFRVGRRMLADLAAWRPVDAILRAVSGPALLARLPAVRQSRAEEAAGPAHLGDAPVGDRSGEREVTPTTRFFRNRPQLDVIFEHVLPRAAAGSGRARVIVHGCSTGAEPYSLAMEWLRRAPAWRPVIRAGDRERRWIARARRAEYERELLPAEALPFTERAKEEGNLALADEVRRLVSFEWIDLRTEETLPTADVVLCQNVLVHLDPRIEEEILVRLAASLAPGGWLVAAGRNPASASVLRDLGFAPLDVRLSEIHEAWTERRAAYDGAGGDAPPYWSLPPYDPSLPDAAFVFGTIFELG